MSLMPSNIQTVSFRSAIFTLICGTLILISTAQAQQVVYFDQLPPESQYGNVVLNSHATTSIGPVVFEHWLHRDKFTCRVCHVDIGFAMQANATGIDAKTNAQGYYCGVCHDGKHQFGNVTMFPSCLPGQSPSSNDTCSRCHESARTKRKFTYSQLTSRLPKVRYGVDWMSAEKSQLVKPVDIVEQASIPRERIKNRVDVEFRPNMSMFKGIRFSHELHSKWNGCELCHPEIFLAEKDGKVTHINMYEIARGRQCGACHLKVAFPVNGCSQCHLNGPNWGWHYP
jgi:c(7)-type cytochrome triheme protein